MKKQISMTQVILLCCILPALCCSIFIMIISGKYIQKSVEDETELGLRAMGNAIIREYNLLDDGEYHLDENGNLLKGKTMISGNNELLDEVKNLNNIDATIFYKNTRKTTSLKNEDGSRNIETKCASDVEETVLNKSENYFVKNIDINGTNYYGYYIPLKNGNEVVGMVFTGKPSTDIDETISSSVKVILLASISILIIAIILSCIIGKMIAKKIKNTLEFIEELEKGNLSYNPKYSTSISELTKMKKAMSQLQDRLNMIISDIKKRAENIKNASVYIDEHLDSDLHIIGDINTAMDELAKGAMEMAENVENTASSMQNINNNISDISDLTKQSSTAVIDVQNISDYTGKEFKKLILANKQTNEAAQNVVSGIKESDEAVMKIKEAAEIISEIADQTNLLSLNAAIEAAHAGDSGKGFAVVADEIKKLAENSNASANEIKKVIENIIQKSQNNIELATQIKNAAENEKEMLMTANESFSEVNKEMKTTADSIHETENKFTTLNEESKTIFDAVSTLSSISEENAASTQETNASTEELKCDMDKLIAETNELKEIANSLNKEMEFFKVK